MNEFIYFVSHESNSLIGVGDFFGERRGLEGFEVRGEYDRDQAIKALDWMAGWDCAI